MLTEGLGEKQLFDIAGTATPEILSIRRQGGAGKFQRQFTGGMASDRHGQVINAARATPNFGGETRIKRAQVEKELAFSSRRTTALEIEALRAELETALIKSGKSPIERAGRLKLFEGLEGFSSEEALAQLRAAVEAAEGKAAGRKPGSSGEQTGIAATKTGDILQSMGLVVNENTLKGSRQEFRTSRGPQSAIRPFDPDLPQDAFPGKGAAGAMLDRLSALGLLRDGASQVAEAASEMIAAEAPAEMESNRQGNEGF